ncbi:hypothetical protein HC028_18605 [Planosporangium flavigriseum]|uniref:Lipoprotein n=1 Tax=Planosporangium flavigriseum TaxID=373681 RepID=A0A8J3LPB5_9ACTN|nr:hypothetical protein [Planosporangium flavigriseum]NJC66500.1 hypothetical protein [Planosporangium flavigriseum]GIG76377.1 hypothetical protein Pfl04_47810 [Planosporangium flavigriseum]
MRGLIAVAALCGVTLFSAGCGGGTAPAPAAKFVQPSLPAATSPDSKAQAICTDLRANVFDADATAFGAELGRLMAARTQQDPAGEERSRQAATAKLGEIAAKLRTHAGEAADPRFRRALNASAVNLEKMGNDPGTLAKLDSLDAVSKTTGRFAAALGDAAEYCGA